MNIDPADASTKEMFPPDETEQLVVLDHRSCRKRSQEFEHLGSVVEVSTGKFANDEWMDRDDPELQLIPQARFDFAQMLDPD